MNYLTGATPRHHYCWVDTAFTHKDPVGFVPCVWFGLVSYPSRAWGCTILFECGAVYRNLPIHSLAFGEQKPDPPEWSVKDAQTWDCYGLRWSALEYEYLRELRCKARCNKAEYDGEYLFSVAPIMDGFSCYPEQAKEFTFVKLDNGRLTAQPTNHVLFYEQSFTTKVEFPSVLKRQTEIYSAE